MPPVVVELPVRKMIYAANQIESLNAKLRRSVRSRGHFPSHEVAMKLIWREFHRSALGVVDGNGRDVLVVVVRFAP